VILQFGTSRFLQAHVDLMASQAMEQGQDVPAITIVQTTGDAQGRGACRPLPIPSVSR
jgi:tagaturonate reductase